MLKHLIKGNGLKIMFQHSSYLIHSSQIGRSKKHITSIKPAHALCAKQLRRLSLGFIPLGARTDKNFPHSSIPKAEADIFHFTPL